MCPRRGEQPFLARTGFELLQRVRIEHPRTPVGGERGPITRGARADLAAGRAGLRRAVAVVDQCVRERVAQLRLDRAAQHRAAVAERHQGGEVPPVGVRECRFCKWSRHRVTDDADRRRALVRGEREDLLGVERPLAVDDRLAAAVEADEREPLAATVHQRTERERIHPEYRVDVARDLRGFGDRIERTPAEAARVEEVLVPPHHAFRHARGPAGVEHVDVVAGTRDVGEIARRRLPRPATHLDRARRSRARRGWGRYSSSTIIATSSESSIT